MIINNYGNMSQNIFNYYIKRNIYKEEDYKFLMIFLLLLIKANKLKPRNVLHLATRKRVVTNSE